MYSTFPANNTPDVVINIGDYLSVIAASHLLRLLSAIVFGVRRSNTTEKQHMAHVLLPINKMRLV